ncbi:MAG: hypothetical protein M1820_009592 [Bogoriella megaspora]|nr:MAG: hypothetical protein M1820_009592 [Bogoriella megaspora]
MADDVISKFPKPEELIPHPVPTYHKTPYSAIAPTLPSLSCSGKSVLVTGGGTGIGLAITRAFAAAHASTVVLTGRRANVIDAAKDSLSKEFPSTKFLTFAFSTGDRDGVDNLFTKLRAEIGELDVLVLNAGYGPSVGPGLAVGDKDVQTCFDTNFFGNWNMVQAYLQPSSGPKKQKNIIDVSTAAAHYTFPFTAVYGASKASWGILLGRLAVENSAEDVRIHSYHPGTIFTDLAKNAGLKEDMMSWDSVDLPGHFAVWLASKEAEFLHGRFVWAHWDVEELKGLKGRVENEPLFLRFGLGV